MAEELKVLLRREHIHVFAELLCVFICETTTTGLVVVKADLISVLPLDPVRPNGAACDFPAGGANPTGGEGVTETVVIAILVDDHRLVVDALWAPERGSRSGSPPEVVIAN